MIPKNEQAMPLVKAVEAATGYRPHLSTVLRWTQRANRHGVRLESWFVGGRRVTSVEAVDRYHEATTQASEAKRGNVAVETPRKRGEAHARAVAELDKELA